MEPCSRLLRWEGLDGRQLLHPEHLEQFADLGHGVKEELDVGELGTEPSFEGGEECLDVGGELGEELTEDEGEAGELVGEGEVKELGRR